MTLAWLDVCVDVMPKQAAFETYHFMSEKWFIHASPTLFNSGTDRPQLSSCFLLTMKEDSINGIYDTLKQVDCPAAFSDPPLGMVELLLEQRAVDSLHTCMALPMDS